MERRLETRMATNVQLNCRVPARPCRAIMHDLSHEGCRLELPHANVELGATALLDLPGTTRFPGRVVWIRSNVAGIRFDRRLGGRAAVALGLDDPEPEPEPAPLEPAGQPNLHGLLRHWIRRLTNRLS